MCPINIMDANFLSQIIFYNVNNRLIRVFIILFIYSMYRRQLLLEYCSLGSKVLLTWINVSVKDAKSSFNSTIYYFCFLSASYSPNLLFMKLMDSLMPSSCLAHLIWATLVEEESSQISLTFDSRFFKQS